MDERRDGRRERPGDREREARRPQEEEARPGEREDRTGRLVEPSSEEALDDMKYEVAEELGLSDDIRERGWGGMTTREVGRIGGNMVRRMIGFAERRLGRRRGLRDGRRG